MDRKTQDVHIIQKDLILFRKFVKNVKEDGKVKYDKPFSDKSNIKKYLFTGYKKSYYPANAFDSEMCIRDSKDTDLYGCRFRRSEPSVLQHGNQL